MTIRSRVGAFSAATVLTLGVAACGSNATPAGSTSPSSPPPAASSASSAATPTTSAPMTMASSTPAMSMPSAPTGPTGPHNGADVSFAQMMLVHHQGAIEMADLAPTRAASAKVKTLAVKIKAAQTPEIAEMKGWLAAWTPAMGSTGMPMSSSHMGSMPGMASGGSSSAMPGMMSPADMDKLKGASGAAFDNMFLEMMTKHHQGAIEMAKTEKSSGQNPAALKLADSIIASQTAEITTMRNLLKGM